jgi:hypothetical protein
LQYLRVKFINADIPNSAIMISAFLKKLLFARQFAMIDGKIEILGKRQVMLPADVFLRIEKDTGKVGFDSIKKGISKDLSDYAKRVGSGEEGMLKAITDIFETFGLGKLEVVAMDKKAKTAAVRIRNTPAQELKEGLSGITCAVLAGAFSFMLGNDVNAKQTKTFEKYGYEEYMIGAK